MDGFNAYALIIASSIIIIVSYFFNVVGRLNPNRDYMKLLDTDEYFKGTPISVATIIENDFEKDTSFCSVIWPGSNLAKCLNSEQQYYGPIEIPLTMIASQEWLRFEADVMIQSREWAYRKYTQWKVEFYHGDKVIKTNSIKLQRLIKNEHLSKHIFFDVQIPEKTYDRCTMTIWNGTSSGKVLIDNLRVTSFQE